MAVDPYLSDEEKRRLRSQRAGLARLQPPPGPPGLARLAQPIVSRAPTPRDAVPLPPPGAGRLDRPLIVVDNNAVEEPGQYDPKRHVNVISPRTLKRDEANEGRRDLRAHGLTRIYKNPDGSYTDMASHAQRGADQRYYSEYGTRADIDMSRARYDEPAADPREYFARENAAAVDIMTDDDAMLRAMETGKQSLDFKRRGLERVAAAEEKRVLDAMEPAQRAALMIAQMREGGLDRRASVDNAIEVRGQDLTFQKDMTNAERQALQLRMDEDARIEEMFAENPEAALRVAMGRLENLSTKERAEALSDPNDPRGAMARKLITQQIAQSQGLDPNFDPAAVTDANWLNRLFGGRFQTNDGVFGGAGFDPSDVGIRDEDMEAIIRGATIQRARK